MLCGTAWCTSSNSETTANTALDRLPPLVFGYTPQVFYNVDPKDAITLIDTWTRISQSNLNKKVKISTVNYKTFEESQKALEKNEVDILVMIPEEFIKLRVKFDLEPVMSADYGTHFYNDLLLVVRKGDGIIRLEQLRHKKMNVDVGQQGTIAIKWLNSQLKTQGLPSSKDFLGSISEFTKSNQALLPVFFGKADSCLVSQSHYETMSEMNPQISSQLYILAHSPGFVTGIIAIRSSVDRTIRETIVKNLENIDSDPKGRQIMTLFRINRLVPFQAEHLKSVEKLIQESEQVISKPRKQ